jgi:4-hydroxy-3-methylbut-2-en-1-yl diphosphate synthase IspG/GcpE
MLTYSTIGWLIAPSMGTTLASSTSSTQLKIKIPIFTVILNQLGIYDRHRIYLLCMKCVRD